MGQSVLAQALELTNDNFGSIKAKDGVYPFVLEALNLRKRSETQTSTLVLRLSTRTIDCFERIGLLCVSGEVTEIDAVAWEIREVEVW